MPLDSGILTVWRGTNTAPAGGMPVMTYKQIWGAYYQDRTIGIFLHIVFGIDKIRIKKIRYFRIGKYIPGQQLTRSAPRSITIHKDQPSGLPCLSDKLFPRFAGFKIYIPFLGDGRMHPHDDPKDQ